MHIDRYISVNRIVDLTSNDLTSAYSELLDTFTTLLPTPAKRKKVLKELVDREKSLTSYLGEGVALPHARVPMKRPYALAIGRCPTGLSFEGKDSYEDVRFVFLLLANEKAKNYLSFLEDINLEAKQLKQKKVRENLKQYKIKISELEADLLYSNAININTFFILLILNKINFSQMLIQ